MILCLDGTSIQSESKKRKTLLHFHLPREKEGQTSVHIVGLKKLSPKIIAPTSAGKKDSQITFPYGKIREQKEHFMLFYWAKTGFKKWNLCSHTRSYSCHCSHRSNYFGWHGVCVLQYVTLHAAQNTHSNSKAQNNYSERLLNLISSNRKVNIYIMIYHCTVHQNTAMGSWQVLPKSTSKRTYFKNFI